MLKYTEDNTHEEDYIDDDDYTDVDTDDGKDDDGQLNCCGDTRKWPDKSGYDTD
jgi:hypothetical protein